RSPSGSPMAGSPRQRGRPPSSARRRPGRCRRRPVPRCTGMSQMPGSPPTSLLLHDGELADVRALLGSLGAPFVERLGSERAQDPATRWSLVIGSARRILDLQLARSAAPPVQIAILAHDARTLRTSLRRSGATLMVRRPVHPAALRALVLHSLYRGPE